MSRPDHEDSSVARLMGAPLAEQAATMAAWGLGPAGLLILMSPCHGQCFFCAQPAVTHPPPSDWTQWDRVQSLIEANRSVGLQHLCIGGTEPTTHPDFEKALTLAGQMGFESIELMTSALSLAEPGIAQRWAQAGVRTIATPIYSTQAEVHDHVMGKACHAQLVAGLDAAQNAGIDVRLHTLALRETLPGLGDLAEQTMARWGTRLSLAPARPKDGVWDYGAQAPGLTEVAEAVAPLPADALALAGWPTCLLPDRPRDAALVISLYFLGQSRAYDSICAPCTDKRACPGVVQALLARDGHTGLSPS